MRLAIAAVGALGKGPEAALADAYIERARGLGRPLGFPDVRLATAAAAPADLPLDRRRRIEAERLVAATPQADRIVALDERGRSLSSVALADMLAAWRDDGFREAAFRIGAADGLDPAARGEAHACLAFGPATWPHALVRAMLCEQLYRAMTILAGHPYHRP